MQLYSQKFCSFLSIKYKYSYAKNSTLEEINLSQEMKWTWAFLSGGR